MKVQTTSPATEAQMRFYDSLVKELAEYKGQPNPESAAKARDEVAADKRYCSRQIDAFQTEVKALRRTRVVQPGWAKKLPEAAVTDGMYQAPDGTVYKVQIAKQGSGNLYAKRLVIEDGHGSFEYAAGAIRTIKAEWKMSLEQAKAFGQLYGICCKCGADLTDEDSIAAGIGPICGSKGW